MNENQYKDSAKLCAWALVGIAVILLAALLSSCKSIQYVPVETGKHDSIYISKIQHDSIYRRDSVYVDRAGDTLYIYKYRYIYKYKNLIDTIYVNRVDSVQVPYPVEKRLSRWQKFEMYAGGASIGAMITVTLIIVVWLVYRLRRK